MQRLEYLMKLMQGEVEAVKPRSDLHRPSFYVPGLTDLAWFDVRELPWACELQTQAPAIRAELLRLRQMSETFQPYRQPKEYGETLQDRGDWDVYYFHLVGKRFDQHCQTCPSTVAALEGIDRLAWRSGLSCFSALSPGTHIPAHCGITNLMIRCHLGLVIPDNCRIRVGDETRQWREGECLVFDDGFEHEVWNDSARERIVLMFDVYHPDLSIDEVEALNAFAHSDVARRMTRPWIEANELTKALADPSAS
jgi:aspartate beta-hydroxylase